jgi:hypothetical protein
VLRKRGHWLMRRGRRSAIAASALGLGLLWLCPPGLAQSGGSNPASSGPYQATPQRPTFTSDTATTAPGTMELELGALFAPGFFGAPVSLKFTPEASRGLFHQMELSLSFEAISSPSVGGRRVTQFGDRLGLVIRRPVYQGESFSLAVAPRATFFLRGDRGARLGVTGPS